MVASVSDQGKFCSPEAFRQCLKTFCISRTLGCYCYWLVVGRAKGIYQNPTIHSTVNTTKSYLAQNVKSAEDEKPWARQKHISLRVGSRKCLQRTRGGETPSPDNFHSILRFQICTWFALFLQVGGKLPNLFSRWYVICCDAFLTWCVQNK